MNKTWLYLYCILKLSMRFIQRLASQQIFRPTKVSEVVPSEGPNQGQANKRSAHEMVIAKLCLESDWLVGDFATVTQWNRNVVDPDTLRPTHSSTFFGRVIQVSMEVVTRPKPPGELNRCAEVNSTQFLNRILSLRGSKNHLFDSLYSF